MSNHTEASSRDVRVRTLHDVILTLGIVAIVFGLIIAIISSKAESKRVKALADQEAGKGHGRAKIIEHNGEEVKATALYWLIAVKKPELAHQKAEKAHERAGTIELQER